MSCYSLEIARLCGGICWLVMVVTQRYHNPAYKQFWPMLHAERGGGVSRESTAIVLARINKINMLITTEIIQS